MDKTAEKGRCYARYRLECDLLCLGEPTRGGVFHPCAKVFSYTALIGALKARFPHPTRRIHAAAKFTDKDPDANRPSILTFAPRERAVDISAVPLQIEHLVNVTAEMFVLENDFTVQWPESFQFALGALKSKGFGQMRAEKIDEVKGGNPQQGELAVRLPIDKTVLEAFDLRNQIRPRYGYLYRPDTGYPREQGGTGRYHKSLFEGSFVAAHPVVLRETTK